MAGETAPPSTVDLNAPEIQAVVEHRVQTATAELRQRAEKAEADLAAANTKVDVLEAEKAAAETAKATAESELASLKTEVENERASATRRDSRRAALVEVAAHLNDDWFGAKVKDGDQEIARLDKIARMDDAAFEDYKSEIASAFAGVTVAPAAGGGAGTSGGTPPRETAMAATNAGGGAGDKPKPSSQWIGSVSAFSGRR